MIQQQSVVPTHFSITQHFRLVSWLISTSSGPWQSGKKMKNQTMKMWSDPILNLFYQRGCWVFARWLAQWNPREPARFFKNGNTDTLRWTPGDLHEENMKYYACLCCLHIKTWYEITKENWKHHILSITNYWFKNARLQTSTSCNLILLMSFIVLTVLLPNGFGVVARSTVAY